MQGWSPLQNFHCGSGKNYFSEAWKYFTNIYKVCKNSVRKLILANYFVYIFYLKIIKSEKKILGEANFHWKAFAKVLLKSTNLEKQFPVEGKEIIVLSKLPSTNVKIFLSEKKSELGSDSKCWDPSWYRTILK